MSDFLLKIQKPKEEFYLNFMHDVQFCSKKYASIQLKRSTDSLFYGIKQTWLVFT